MPFASWLLTRPNFAGIVFSETGQIGDTIGGTTAPLLGLISIALLYMTFRSQDKFNKEQLNFNKEQLSFNRIQQKASDYDVIMRLRSDIITAYNSFDLVISEYSNARKLKDGASLLELVGANNGMINCSENEILKTYSICFDILYMYNLLFEIAIKSSLDKVVLDSILKSIGWYIIPIQEFMNAARNNKLNIFFKIHPTQLVQLDLIFQQSKLLQEQWKNENTSH